VACRPADRQEKVKLLINGEFRDSKTNNWIEVINPVSCAHARAVLANAASVG